MTKENALKSFITHLTRERYSPNTIRIYERNLRAFLEFVRTDDISRVRIGTLASYRAHVEKAEESFKTKNLRLVPVQSFFGFLLQSGHTKLETKRSLAQFKPRNSQQHLHLPSQEDVARFLAPQGTPPFLDLFVVLAYHTGLRIHELMALRAGEVQEGFAIVGKGGKQRFVAVPAPVVALVRSYEAEQPLTTPKLFPYSDRHMQLLFRRRSQALKVKITPHTLRHCYATFLLSRGVPIQEVQRLLGHSSITTTMIYTHVVDSQLAASVHRAFSPQTL